ncbi:GNAT family N-acetyltransferase [Subsaxibacter sp. CAU 1640]|uniref:GNAT family N-acetyltransferase n=1 Tax=Subsaxibacter sp. CAU 1640 TaxID=2933271 RepID=UPI002006836F|nr:GNAT family N-acetyltransferase [Subsaxibacter sp. CAU 1640]MCK7591039.1 GNAT family N-acetyltransferase [Subsaxibacter sp. CAU 1640]
MNNPFTSKLFVEIWSKHFNNSRKEFKFGFINHVSFYKTKFFPLYINIGKNLTKGIYYTLDYQKEGFRKKAFLIYDVPDFFGVESFDNTKSALKRNEIFQYQGFLLNFKGFPTAQDYINSRISSKNRRGLRSRQERLEKCFDISYRFYTDDISKEEFDVVFRQFHELLSDRFSGKKVNYHHLRPDKWAFHNEFSYEMMKENRASLFVIYNKDLPIAVTLNIHSDDIVFVSITVFDPDYYKFNIGKTTIVKIIEWCYENDMKIADFSKGDFDFKHEWCNITYDFDYHLLYDSKSFRASTIALAVRWLFETKRYLRDKNVNVFYRKLLYKLKKDENGHPEAKYRINDLQSFEVSSNYERISLQDNKYQHLKVIVYSFLFLNSESFGDISIYKRKSSKKEYVIKGTEKAQSVIFN